MALNGNLIAIIGRLHPAIYDVVFPRGPVLEVAYAARHTHAHAFAHRAAELNPQPLPPKEIFVGIEIGAAVGHELVRAAGFAKAFKLEFAFDIIDICPPPRPWPPLPWPWPFPWPPRPYPWRVEDIGPDFEQGYALGLGAVLEATADVWQQLPASGFLEELYGAVGELARQDLKR